VNCKINDEIRMGRLALLFSIAKKIKYYRNKAWVDAYIDGLVPQEK
jgi:hypothetical protein